MQDLIKVLSSDVLKNGSCIEMNFSIDGNQVYDNCWLGKMPDREDSSKESYWLGLVWGGSQAYSYDNLEDLLNAKVFNGMSIMEVISNITWYSLDGCDIEEMLPYYIDDDENRPFRSAAY